MFSVVQSLARQLVANIPLMLVILLGLVVSVQNIDVGKHYSGWDNIHAELNISAYIDQIVSSAWISHQGFGAPAAQAHLSELSRLPIIYLLTLLVPENLVRYTHIFLMFSLGGISMYLYMRHYWLSHVVGRRKKWLAALGATMYMLHILTLQQFYIAFEMFTVQFALLPLLLISVHKLVEKPNVSSLVMFLLVQLAIAPSAHTPTVFYLGALFSIVYSFFLKYSSSSLLISIKFAAFIGMLTVLANVYWIVPNIYYSVAASHYVQESRTNQIFAPESIWSIREAGTFSALLTGKHYLFSWKDYNFASQQFDFIFDEWEAHLNSFTVEVILHGIGVVTLIGAWLSLRSTRYEKKRFAILFTLVGSIALLFIDLFPTKYLIDILYQSGSFTEAFRNPVTKLSIIYSFVISCLFIVSIEQLLQSRWLEKFKHKHVAEYVVLAVVFSVLIYSSLPTLTGNFISEKLQIVYPDEYAELYDFMGQLDSSSRVLQLPQPTHTGWEYYDWQFLGKGNGYQGMGFHLFGISQPLVHRDADRWGEASDFFFHELRHALDLGDSELLFNVLRKYNVDLVLIDDTRIDPQHDIDSGRDHQLITEVGYTPIWQKSFLTLYAADKAPFKKISSPHAVSMVYGNTQRVMKDVIFQGSGNYILSDSSTEVLFPFSDVYQEQRGDISFNYSSLRIQAELPSNVHTIVVPSRESQSSILTPVALTLKGKIISVVFPQYSIEVGGSSFALPSLKSTTLTLPNHYDQVVLFINEIGILLEQDTLSIPTVSLEKDRTTQFSFAQESAVLTQESVILEDIQLQVLDNTIDLIPDNYFDKQVITTEETRNLVFISDFPANSFEIAALETENCSAPRRGTVKSLQLQSGVQYSANNFGVNCSSASELYESTASAHYLFLTGENIRGRGLKIFVNTDDSNVMIKELVINDADFEQFFAIEKIGMSPTDRFRLNWETRSFGKMSQTELHSLQIIAFPQDWIARITAVPEHKKIQYKSVWELEFGQIISGMYSVRASCDGMCPLVLDTAYDPLWIAIDVQNMLVLPHFHYNGWANAWILRDDFRGFVIYVPTVFVLAGVIGSIFTLVIVFRRFQASGSSKQQNVLRRSFERIFK